MDDNQIIELFFRRDEQAIYEIERKYMEMCSKIAFNILNNNEDCDEALNDTWLKVWNSIPPEKPKNLPAYLTVIVRNTSIDKYRKNMAVKQLDNDMKATLEEISDIIPDTLSVEKQLESKELINCINNFIETLSKKQRIIFIRRYYYFYSIRDIAEEYGWSVSYITVNLTRIKSRLNKHIEKENLI